MSEVPETLWGPLWRHMHAEYGLILVDDECNQIARACDESRKAEYPERIEESWRADAGWQRADEAEAKLEQLREAVRNFRDVSGRYHTQMAAARLIALLPENAEL